MLLGDGVDATHEVADHFGAPQLALAQAKIGVLDVFHGIAHVVELNLVGAGFDGFRRQIDDVLLHDLVGGVEPPDVERPFLHVLHGEIAAFSRQEVVGKTDDAHRDADAARVRELDGTRQILDLRRCRGPDLVGELDLGGVGDATVGVFHVDDHEVHAARGHMIEHGDETFARRHERAHVDPAQRVCFAPTEAPFGGTLRQSGDDLGDAKRRTRRGRRILGQLVFVADGAGEILGEVDLREIDVRIGDVAQRLVFSARCARLRSNRRNAC